MKIKFKVFCCFCLKIIVLNRHSLFSYNYRLIHLINTTYTVKPGLLTEHSADFVFSAPRPAERTELLQVLKKHSID